MLGEKQQPVRIKLMDGDVVRGWIEYYDRRMVRLTREGAAQPVHLQARDRLHRRRRGIPARSGGPGVKNGNSVSASE